MLIEGPVEIVGEDGTITTSSRFVVAVCTCRRSRTYPLCDTSHRGHKRPPDVERGAHDGRRAGNDPEVTHDGDQR